MSEVKKGYTGSSSSSSSGEVDASASASPESQVELLSSKKSGEVSPSKSTKSNAKSLKKFRYFWIQRSTPGDKIS